MEDGAAEVGRQALDGNSHADLCERAVSPRARQVAINYPGAVTVVLNRCDSVSKFSCSR